MDQVTRATDRSKAWSEASAAGAIVTALVSSACCLGPLVFAALGIGGAGLLVKLTPYRVPLATLTLLLLATGFYLTYRRPRVAAPPNVALHVEGMTCPSCKAAVRTAIGRLPGVTGAKVDLEKKTATVEYDASKVSPQQMVEAVNRLGYEASLPVAGGR